MKAIIRICFFFLLIYVSSSCCQYLPFVDQQTIHDYDEKDFQIQGNKSLLKNDSILIELAIKALLPNKCRSRKQRDFSVTMKLDIRINKYKDTLFSNLTKSGFISYDGKNNLNGVISLTNVKEDVFLIIVEDKYYITQNGANTNSLNIDFDYKKNPDFNYGNQVLKIKLNNFYLSNGRRIKAEEILSALGISWNIQNAK